MGTYGHFLAFLKFPCLVTLHLLRWFTILNRVGTGCAMDFRRAFLFSSTIDRYMAVLVATALKKEL
jgi:hypothetical protein